MSVQKGFTLIELLLVIAIIGILAGIIVRVVDVTEYQKQARDARRINDILSVHTAITTAIVGNGVQFTDTSSCSSCDSISGTLDVDGTGWIKFQDLSGRGLKDFIPILPEDPINTGNLKFSYYSDGERFELNAVFESDRYSVNAVNDGGNDIDVYERGWDLEIK